MVNWAGSSWPVVGAALCGPLLCQPARADYYAFGDTQGHFATLALNGATCPVSNLPGPSCLSTDGFEGWVETASFNVAGAAGNTNYLAGLFDQSLHNNFFVFDVAGHTNVTSAALVIYSGVITNGFDYNLHSVTGTGFQTTINQQNIIFSPNTSFYNDIENGPTYATYSIGPSSPTSFDIALDGLAVNDINAAIQSESGLFAIGGSVTPNPPIVQPPSVPEASTWVMMLSGFACLGFNAYRRTAKLRVATHAG